MAAPPKKPKSRSKKNSVAVRRGTAADVDVLKTTLARAFSKEPFIKWFVPPSPDRFEIIQEVYRIYLEKFALPHPDGVWMTEDGKAATLWAPPGEWRMSPMDQFRLIPDFLRVIGARRFLSRMAGIGRMEKLHASLPHYYLMVIGTDPDFEGRGYGSAVMQPVLDKCDEEGIGAFLETADPTNLPIYEHWGFETQNKLETLPGEGPPIWFMWREPR